MGEQVRDIYSVSGMQYREMRGALFSALWRWRYNGVTLYNAIKILRAMGYRLKIEKMEDNP